MLAPLEFKVVDWPRQKFESTAVTFITGNGFMVTTEVVVPVHPFKSVPVMVYVIVEVGLAVTVAPVVELIKMFGDHE